MKRPVTLIRNAAGTYVATKLSERLVRNTRKQFSGSLVRLAVGGLALWGGVVIAGSIFGAAIGAAWWVLALPFHHPILTTITGLGGYLYFKLRKLLG